MTLNIDVILGFFSYRHATFYWEYPSYE